MYPILIGGCAGVVAYFAGLYASLVAVDRYVYPAPGLKGDPGLIPPAVVIAFVIAVPVGVGVFFLAKNLFEDEGF